MSFTTAITVENVMTKSNVRPVQGLVEPAWLDGYAPEQRDVLREHGIPPDADRRALEFNERVVGLLADGLDPAAFRAAIEDLKDDMFGEGRDDGDDYEPDGDDIGD